MLIPKKFFNMFVVLCVIKVLKSERLASLSLVFLNYST